ncbi:MAG: YggT family protein [Gemmatimonadaceae bacterium]|nr:YggT family protein [Gemmatimonadaceae bacterium]
MNTLMPMIDSAISGLRIALLVVGAVFLLIAVLDWAVRARRINPFSPIARFCRRVIDPMLVPIESRVVRAGGIPSQAPWWGLAAVVVIGVLMIVLLQWIRATALSVSFAATEGGMGIARLVLAWTFELLKIALIVRVIVSWIGMRYSWWARAAYSLTDWLVKPIARVLPPFGMMDFSPLVAYLLIYLVESVVLGSLFG